MAVGRRTAPAAVGAALAALLAAGAVLALRSPERRTDPGASAVPSSAAAPSAPTPAGGWVTVENRRQKTSGWRISHAGPPDAIQGWPTM
jgi:hypothetical protein